jgi:NADPH:quinone reductase-like Zn-dependent oxidoreductase
MPAEETAQRYRVRTSGVQAPPIISGILRQLAELIEAGVIQADLGPVFLLEQAVQAHQLSEIGHGRGRIVLHVAD